MPLGKSFFNVGIKYVLPVTVAVTAGALLAGYGLAIAAISALAAGAGAVVVGIPFINQASDEQLAILAIRERMAEKLQQQGTEPDTARKAIEGYEITLHEQPRYSRWQHIKNMGTTIAGSVVSALAAGSLGGFIGGLLGKKYASNNTDKEGADVAGAYVGGLIGAAITGLPAGLAGGSYGSRFFSTPSKDYINREADYHLQQLMAQKPELMAADQKLAGGTAGQPASTIQR